MKRILLLLLACISLFTLVCIPAFADGLDVEEYDYVSGYELSYNGNSFYIPSSQSEEGRSIPVVSCTVDGQTYYGGTIRSSMQYSVRKYIYYKADGQYISSGNLYPMQKVVFASAQSFVLAVAGVGEVGTVSTVPLTQSKVSVIGEGFRSVLSATGSVLSFLTSSALLPYFGLIIGISVLTAVLIYIKWLL